MADDQNKTFYVTTPIYYVTAKPHLGSLYTTVLADVAARWHKLQGHKTYCVTGTDEHGQKIAQAAAAVHKTPQEFVDGFIADYAQAWSTYSIAYDHFVRTTDTYHQKAVQEWIRSIVKKGDIYKDRYEGWYCTPCETFVTEKESQDEKSGAYRCPSCNRETVLLQEETYFFKLSAYQDRLLAFYEQNPDFIVPKERANELISFIKSGLKDLSISRTTVAWGIPFPDDEDHVVYVWADALMNYLSAIGYGNSEQKELFATWWPAQLQILGKDIIRFHGIYWLAFLMAADLPLSKQLLVHGWIRVNKEKMSKSLGNVVDPMVLAQTYGAEQIRYYLVRQMAITHDGEFSIEDIEQRITADLANDLGNLLNRMVMLAQANDTMTVAQRSVWGKEALAVRDECWNMIEEYHSYMDQYQFHMALARLWKFINVVNAYFHEQEPWKLAKQDGERFQEVLSVTAHSLRAIGVLAWPVMPHKMEALLNSLGYVFNPGSIDSITRLELSSWHLHFNFIKIPPLFEKVVTKMVDTTAKKLPDAGAQTKNTDEGVISIDDVIKVELRVGTIETCAPVPNSEKLLQMAVNFGDLGMRQILAGIRAFYAPDELLGKQAVFVYNLKPRKMVGLESHGMMLIAKDAAGDLRMVIPSASVKNGTRLQ